MRWDHLEQTKAYFDQKLSDDEKTWLNLVDNGNRTGAEASQALDHAEHVISRTFRFVMLTSFCTFLEEITREFASNAFPDDFESRSEKKTGSKFAKYLSVLVDAGFDPVPVQ